MLLILDDACLQSWLILAGSAYFSILKSLDWIKCHSFTTLNITHTPHLIPFSWLILILFDPIRVRFSQLDVTIIEILVFRFSKSRILQYRRNSRRLDQWILDWTTAVMAGKAAMCQLSGQLQLPQQWSNLRLQRVVQSMNFYGIKDVEKGQQSKVVKVRGCLFGGIPKASSRGASSSGDTSASRSTLPVYK